MKFVLFGETAPGPDFGSVALVVLGLYLAALLTLGIVAWRRGRTSRRTTTWPGEGRACSSAS